MKLFAIFALNPKLWHAANALRKSKSCRVQDLTTLSHSPLKLIHLIFFSDESVVMGDRSNCDVFSIIWFHTGKLSSQPPN